MDQCKLDRKFRVEFRFGGVSERSDGLDSVREREETQDEEKSETDYLRIIVGYVNNPQIHDFYYQPYKEYTSSWSDTVRLPSLLMGTYEDRLVPRIVFRTCIT